MSIDIKTLRIGAHISVGGKRHRITAIDSLNGQIGIEAYMTDENCVKYPHGYKVEDVEPISLTSELLTELGFEYKDKGCWSHWWKGNFHLTRRGESPYWDYEGDISVQYLHELENLYYLIYETELIQD